MRESVRAQALLDDRVVLHILPKNLHVAKINTSSLGGFLFPKYNFNVSLYQVPKNGLPGVIFNSICSSTRDNRIKVIFDDSYLGHKSARLKIENTDVLCPYFTTFNVSSKELEFLNPYVEPNISKLNEDKKALTEDGKFAVIKQIYRSGGEFASRNLALCTLYNIPEDFCLSEIAKFKPSLENYSTTANVLARNLITLDKLSAFYRR
ncbi:MAG: hypothetical protein WCK29_02425 [archaeon]